MEVILLKKLHQKHLTNVILMETHFNGKEEILLIFLILQLLVLVVVIKMVMKEVPLILNNLDNLDKVQLTLN